RLGDGPDVAVRRGPDGQAATGLHGGVPEGGVVAWRDEHPFDGDARLAGVGEAAGHRGPGRRLDVGVVADDHRVLAAQLHDRGRQVGGGRGEDPPGGGRAAGEGDLVHRAAGEGGAGGAVTGDDLD